MSKIMSITLNCIVHVFILFSILTAFFLLYISAIETNTFKTEISDLLGSEVDSLIDRMTDEQKKILLSILDKVDLGQIKQIDSIQAKYVIYNNKWLTTLAFSIIIFLALVIFLIVMILKLACDMKIDFLEIVYENIIIFLFVGSIEISFFIFIAAKFVPVSPSLMTDTLVGVLKEKFHVDK